ncbi:MAG: hypothetical protein KAS32_16350 [Candidatus Peribacteraceae bacterium]|nr:hypothetical protein [Candidatus Peribacteraceae bacterium]
MKERIERVTELEVSDPIPGENRIDINWKVETKEIPENAVIVDRELLEFILYHLENTWHCEDCPLDAECKTSPNSDDCPFTSKRRLMKELERRAGR